MAAPGYGKTESGLIWTIAHLDLWPVTHLKCFVLHALRDILHLQMWVVLCMFYICCILYC